MLLYVCVIILLRYALRTVLLGAMMCSVVTRFASSYSEL